MPKNYLGIDVGWSKSNATTGLCLITVDQANFTWRCLKTGVERDGRLDALRQLIPYGTELSGVGIDGPLGCGLEPVNHYRAAEAMLMGGDRYVFRDRCQPARTDDKRGQDLHPAAIDLAELVLELQEARPRHLGLAEATSPHRIHRYRIVEAFPTAFLAFLLSEQSFPPREEMDREKSDIYWEIAVRHPFLIALTEHLDPECPPNLIRTLVEHLATRRHSYLRALIERLAPGRYLARSLEYIISHEHRAAFVCALTALCVHKQQYVAVGDPKYGDFILPPVEAWGSGPNSQASWVESPLRERVRRVHGNMGEHPTHGKARVIRNGRQWIPNPIVRRGRYSSPSASTP